MGGIGLLPAVVALETKQPMVSKVNNELRSDVEVVFGEVSLWMLKI
jgi:hypothetical protein